MRKMKEIPAPDVNNGSEFSIYYRQRWQELEAYIYYLRSEYEFKEKEYGIEWRAAYVENFHKILSNFSTSFPDPELFTLEGKDAFDAIANWVSIQSKNVGLFTDANQVANVQALVTWLLIIENNVLLLKKTLREPEPSCWKKIAK